MSCSTRSPPSALPRWAVGTALLIGCLLSGCEQLGIDSPERVAAAREADGRAVGGACRHAGRAIEDCYTLYKKADRSAVFAGWRDMNDYMRENKIEVVPPVLAGPQSPVLASASSNGDSAEPGEPARKVAKAGSH